MNKRADNLLILGLVAIMVIAGLAYFLGRTTAQLDAGGADTSVTTTDDSTGDGSVSSIDDSSTFGTTTDDGESRDTTSTSSTDFESEYGSVINSDPVAGYADRTVSVASLPPEAHDTLDAIARGGPFAYSKDGSTFQNREGLLPDHDIGWYQEFTVETPGSSDRGARRIVTGADDEMFYTDDHYDSFRQIVEEAP